MARKQQKITAISYVRVGGELVRTEDLDPERKKELANWLTEGRPHRLIRVPAGEYTLDLQQELLTQKYPALLHILLSYEPYHQKQ